MVPSWKCKLCIQFHLLLFISKARETSCTDQWRTHVFLAKMKIEPGLEDEANPSMFNHNAFLHHYHCLAPSTSHQSRVEPPRLVRMFKLLRCTEWFCIVTHKPNIILGLMFSACALFAYRRILYFDNQNTEQRHRDIRI